MQAANEVIRKQGLAAMSSSEGSSEFLTFTLGREEYGIDILKVQEIRGYNAVTAIANAPAFVKGVINLRGTIVPIVDLRIKFNLDQVVYDQITVVMILNIMSRVVGAVVDSVSDVLRLNPEQIRAAPEFGSGMDTKYITGIGAVDERMLILIDIEKLMASPDMALVDEVEELGA
jgi:purine-binding chemotaxis protein CheW